MIGFAVRRPAVVWAACLTLLLAGGVAFSRLPLATRTTVELPRLTIVAGWHGSAPEVVEAYLTSPLEAAAQGVRGVRKVSSRSIDGGALLTVELEPKADVQMTRLALLERIELLRSEFPAGVSSPGVRNFVPEGLEEAPLLSITINGPYTSGTLQRMLEDRVNPRLSAVPGVSSIVVRGGATLGVAIKYDDLLLRRLGINPASLTHAVSNARVTEALGAVQRGGNELSVVLRDEPKAIEDLLELPIVGPGRRVFRLGDFAVARAEEDARGVFFRIDGSPAVAAEILRHPGADAIKTARALREAIAELEPRLPPVVQLRVVNDESEALARELSDLGFRGSIALGSVLVVLVIMLRRWRPVVLVMGSTIVAVAATALTLYLLDVPANLLTLAGLGMGVGILVQNGLVVVQRLGTEPDTPEGRARAARRIAPAVTGSTMATAVVLFPFLYLQGDARAAFVPFAVAFVLALAWSVCTALLVVPALGKGAGVQQAVWPRARRVYVRSLGMLMRWRAVTLVATAAVLGVLAWGFVHKVPRSSYGSWGERRTTLSVHLSFPRGSDPGSLDAGMREFERIVRNRPEIEQVRTQSAGTSAQMFVMFTRAGGTTSAPLEVQEKLTQRAVLIGGASVSVQGDGPGFSSGGGGGSFSTFRMRVMGYSYDGVGAIADDLKTRLEAITRVRDVRITSGGYYGGNDRGSQVTLDPDRAALARYGVSSTALTQAIAREVRGAVGRQSLEIAGDEVPVTVKAAGARDRTMDELAAAIVPTATGAPVRIGDLSYVSEREALSAVVREDQQYLRQVSYDFRGPPKLARRTQDAFMKSLSAPAGYSITDLSTGDLDRDNSEEALWQVFAIGVVLVLLAVALVFDSVWGSAMVFLSLPMSLAGVAAAFWGLGAAFTREAAVGVILVVGLAVNHAILLVDAVLQQRRARRDAGLDMRLDAATVLRASLDRAGMIFFVTLASLASLAPLSIGTSAASLFGAIALATAGGTVFGTAGALLVLPVMLVGRRREQRTPRGSGGGPLERSPAGSPEGPPLSPVVRTR
ncbi:MAG TPA: efflux RND transporter permease subunit [Gemmatimonas sp.]|nr:efflux RND transporter permease subunit [Gemmatimonas sp.]